MIIVMPLVKEDEMDAINPQQRRTTLRNPGNTIEPVRLRLDEGDFIGEVQDISIAGISNLTGQRLEPGACGLCWNPPSRTEICSQNEGPKSGTRRNWTRCNWLVAALPGC
jgi:hypothetical protein